MAKSKSSKSKKSSGKSSSKKTSKKTTTVEPEVVEETVVETTPTVESTTTTDTTSETTSTTSTTETVEVSLDDQFKTAMGLFMENLSTMNTAYKSAMSQAKLLQKLHNRQVKQLSKKTRRKNTSNGPRKPSGFAKPTQVTDALCKFLNEKKGTLLARTDVTKRITQYIKDKDLQDPLNRKRILLDKPLQKLLNVDDSVEVTYFNLQKYMKHNYIKSTPAVVPAVASV